MLNKFKNLTGFYKFIIIAGALFVLFGIIGAIGDQTNEVEEKEEEPKIEEPEIEEIEIEEIEVEDLEKEEKEEDFIKEAKKKSDKKKAKDEAEKEKGYTQENWKEFKTKFMDHYGDADILDIQVNPGSEYTVFNVFVPNEFKLSSEEEKQYYVEEIGGFMQQDLDAEFPENDVIHIHFKYQDGNTMAKAKMFGGWKIK